MTIQVLVQGLVILEILGGIIPMGVEVGMVEEETMEAVGMVEKETMEAVGMVEAEEETMVGITATATAMEITATGMVGITATETNDIDFKILPSEKYFL
jgi:hypothetical protein